MAAAVVHASDPLAPGELVRIGNDVLAIDASPAAGGRIAQITFEGNAWLRGHAEDPAAIAWGCYPMLPWAGRLRNGCFGFGDREFSLHANLGAHAIHGVGFTLPWRIATHAPALLELTLQLPRDHRWPFGGIARQRLQLRGHQLHQELTLSATDGAMPLPVLGWHPWFIKPERLEFRPSGHYPRDAAGIATAPQPGLPPAPWDDCFIHSQAVSLWRHGQRLRLESSCDHWVLFDERPDATCVEPQTGPPDAFNLLRDRRLEAGASISAWFELSWLREPGES